MGDMADAFLEDVELMEDLRLDYRMGKMSTGDAYEAGIIDERGFQPSARTGSAKVCRCCGKGGLEWMRSGDRWVLGQGGVIHNCPNRPLGSK